MNDPDDDRRSLAEALEVLFDTVRVVGEKGRRYTNEEVAAAIRRSDPSIRVGGAYLSALRTGAKKNPSTELLRALARFFGVSVSYFVDPESAERHDAELALARVASNNQVRNLALRALELSPEALAAVSAIVESVLSRDDTATRRG